jgi:hypothetical protein
MAHKEDGTEREYGFKCDDEQSCMVWVNRITMSLAMSVDQKANAAKERLAESGTVKWTDLNDTVRSLGGDFKYLKDPDLEEMQNITAKELRFVAPCVGHELSFKEARDMVTRARKHEGTVDFLTFLTMIAFKAGFDCAFVLAYTTIMLNTDAHNPRLKGQKRLTCAQFIENNRRSPDLATISDEYFAQLYDEIKMNEIKMNDDDVADAADVDGGQGAAREASTQVKLQASLSADATTSSILGPNTCTSPSQAAEVEAAAEGTEAALATVRTAAVVDSAMLPEGLPPEPEPQGWASASNSEGLAGAEHVATVKLEKLFRAHMHGALSMEMFQRMVNKVASDLPVETPLRLKLEKLDKAVCAGAISAEMYHKMLRKQVDSCSR